MARNNAKKIIAAVFALLVWQIASMIVGHDILLASPAAVIRTLWALVRTSDFWKTVFFSFLRIAAGFGTSLTAGLILAILSSRFEWVRTLIHPFMLTIKSVPIASFIVLSLIWLSSRKLVSFVCFVACFPMIYNNILEGLKSVDPLQKEAAQDLGARWPHTVRTVMIPQIRPYISSAVSTGCGMSFKAGVAAEVVAIVSGSIGEQIYMSKVYFETAGLFAWTLVIILLSWIFEKIIMLLINGLIRICCK